MHNKSKKYDLHSDLTDSNFCLICIRFLKENNVLIQIILPFFPMEKLYSIPMPSFKILLYIYVCL